MLGRPPWWIYTIKFIAFITLTLTLKDTSRNLDQGHLKQATRSLIVNDLLEYLDSLLEDGLLGDLGHRKRQKSGHSRSSFPGFELRNSSRCMTSVDQKYSTVRLLSGRLSVRLVKRSKLLRSTKRKEFFYLFSDLAFCVKRTCLNTTSRIKMSFSVLKVKAVLKKLKYGDKTMTS